MPFPESLPEGRNRELAKILSEKLNSKLENLGLRLMFQYDEYYDNIEYLILVEDPFWRILRLDK